MATKEILEEIFDTLFFRTYHEYMNEDLTKKLLKDKRVVEEIHRHLWIESEKAGYDIGFDKAAEDWLKNFSKAWMSYNIPKH